jgi:leucyl/phenylalanyl-tRNA--protein transferase
MKSPQIKWISQDDPADSFPDASHAFDVPDGLLAAGGDLSQERLLYAYRHGIFPWYDDGQPILWWSPDPRCVLRPENFHTSRRLDRFIRNCQYEVTFNSAFGKVIDACADERPDQQGTWINQEMIDAYKDLHETGWAHSVEVWSGTELVGGLYGLAIGDAFFGESMFSRRSNASKVAMHILCRELGRLECKILDCQVESPHLMSLGATLMPRAEFLDLLQRACAIPSRITNWPAGQHKISDLGGD